MRPLLLFDSGVGGLSVLCPVRAALPYASVVYVADNGGFPYGTKSEAEIAARVPALLGRLVERYRPALVVIACNTASTIALAGVRAALAVPVVGTVPAIKPAAARSVTRAIGVLGTAATVRQPYVDKLTAEFAADCLVLRHGSARLVEFAEAKLRGRSTSLADYATELEGLLGQPGGERVDTVVLACTHFPLIADELTAAAVVLSTGRAGAARPLTFVDGGAGIARRVAYLLRDVERTDEPHGTAVFTARHDGVDALGPALHSYGLATIDYL